ncbi:hypothetical protein V7S43_011465 [Phytophthora oleae]|uniref:Uncharacterized protein n=1 Tax=Phytophthora oleae TaxID=2107226 RepID=A0ABD3F9Z2_9STRA
MKVATLHRDLTQCWLAEALVQVLERAASNFPDGRHLLVSLGDAAIAEQGAALSALLKGFLCRDTVANIEKSIGEVEYKHVATVDELQHWTKYQSIAGELLIMVYAPCKKEIAVKHVEAISLGFQSVEASGLMLLLHNPSGLLDLNDSGRLESSDMYHLKCLGALETERNLKFVVKPLDSLRDQCGWHFVMEIVRWIPESETTTSGKAARAPMFSSITQLPFQMLLLVLRWSHFHPEVVRACAKKLRRQTQLIPQIRVRQELAELQRHQPQIWSSLYPVAEIAGEISVARNQEKVMSNLFVDSSFQAPVAPELARLSECCLWDTQKQFYKDQGIRAWSSGTIPFGVSSSSFLAAAYAQVVVDFLLSNADCVQPSFKENGPPNCFVWEAASGSCKFLHSFLLHFTELVESTNEFKRRGLVPLVVATDLSEQVLSSRRRMACFRPFIERGQLDFALFDTQDFVHGTPSLSGRRKTLELVHSQRQWHVGSDGPVALMGNYFLDSLRADIFTVGIQKNENSSGDNSEERVVLQTALLDKSTSSIADMNIHLRAVDPSTQAIYPDERLNATLMQVLDQFRAQVSTTTGLIVFPVEAFEFFLALMDKNTFPVAILAGDARFSFRDAISSAFTTIRMVESPTGEAAEQIGLELPQLSPHPDCFCLPVDFEVIQIFFDHLSRNPEVSASSEVVSAPASDTFDVFFATIEPQRRKKSDQASLSIRNMLRASFRHKFASFTPGDCDLLWGMISFDDGARCFSVDTLLALLAQTGWDFDLFAVLQWELLDRLRREDNTSEHYQRLLVDAGVKAWRTFYHMEQQTEADVTTKVIRLQLARWFYELEAFDNVLDVLHPWRDETQQDISLDDVGVFYLLGLTSLRMDEYWTALSFFRLCARLAPTKLKFQRQVARTLLALQTLRSSSNSSNDSP